MLLHDARRDARTAPDGSLVLLGDQDRSRWSPERIAEGTRVLERALSHRRPGTYQLQAAIAALHVEDGETDWPQIAALYGELARFEPSPIVELNRAVAVAMAEGPENGLMLVERIDLPEYHLLHATRADLLRRLERREEAAAAYRAALALEMNAGDRAFLERRLAEVQDS
jgi:RNA polymerase sigma-70 factor (ECF subfamily)